MKNHVTCDISYGCSGMSGSIVEQMGEGLEGSLGGMSLLCRKCADGGEHGGVDCARIVKESAEDFLDVGAVGSIQGR